MNLYVLHLDRAFLEAFDVLERFPSRTPLEDARLLNDGLGELAGQAGGAYFNLTVAIDPAFERIARETSASYLVAFEPAPDDRDGKAHNVSITVARPGVHVRARRQFTVDPAAASASMAQRVTRALNSPHLPVTVPMDLTTYVIGDSRAGGVRVLMAAEIGCGAGTTADFEVGHLASIVREGRRSAVQRPPDSSSAEAACAASITRPALHQERDTSSGRWPSTRRTGPGRRAPLTRACWRGRSG